MTTDTAKNTPSQRRAFTGPPFFPQPVLENETAMQHSYALEQGGHDMGSDSTYKILDPDMTKQKLDQLSPKLEVAQPRQDTIGPRQSVQNAARAPNYFPT